MSDDSQRNNTLGQKIAFHRQRRGLSQVEFAKLIRLSETWVSQVERGVRPVKNLDALERIATVLDIPLADLAPTAPQASAEQRPPEAIPLRLLLSANYALRAVLGTPPTHDLKQLQRDTVEAWTLTHDSRYDELIPLLETLLPRLEAIASSSTEPEVFALLARSYHACAAALAKLQQFDAAWVAADRAISDAGRAGDPLLMAEGAFRLTLIFQGARQLDQAEHTAATASTALEGLVEQGVPEALSVYGALKLQQAVIAARIEQPTAAAEYLARAREIATRLGKDRNDYHTEFGPTNVTLHEIAIAVELGDAGTAIRLAETVDATGLSTERQGRLLIDVARAWTQRRNAEQALAALEHAERIAPEQVYSHRFVPTIIHDLIQTEPDNLSALQDFAQRANQPDRLRLESGGPDFPQRLAAVLLELALQYDPNWAEGTQVDLHVSQGELARIARVSRSTLARGLEELRKLDVVRTARHRITIMQPTILRKLAAGKEVSTAKARRG